MRLLYLLLFLSLFLTVNAFAQGTSNGAGSSSKRSNVTVLKSTLETLDLEHPEEDVTRNVAKGEFTFFGINGYSCDIPNDKLDFNPLIQEYGIRCLEGTSDMVEGEEHRRLIERATVYAQSYNSSLKKWLQRHKGS